MTVDTDPRDDLEEYDPFEEFNRSAGAGLVDNPYPLFALARAQGPIIKEDLAAPGAIVDAANAANEGESVTSFGSYGLVGDDDTSGFAAAVELEGFDLPDVFTTFGFDAGQQVLRDGEIFSSKGYADVMGPVLGNAILLMDEPEHHHYRSLVQQAPTLMEVLAPVWVCSPYEVPQLPPELRFDTVLLLDAGATTLVENVGAIRRSRQVVASATFDPSARVRGSGSM